MISIGHGDPAMIPVRSDVRSKRANSGCCKAAMNMVGTPWRAVQRSASIVSNTDVASNVSAGTIMAAPCVTQVIFASTMPKQW